ncbi:MAG: transglycosylase SLT domain-containing protein [Rhodocyclaceae bacterium]|nr:transglycosylase SLT domain-containing protein [Rhodocyclaceae bacterium]MBX3668913.1 transglycosylase SLT domain-containing protein [Rhodocyclaceae bacterium]
MSICSFHRFFRYLALLLALAASAPAGADELPATPEAAPAPAPGNAGDATPEQGAASTVEAATPQPLPRPNPAPSLATVPESQVQSARQVESLGELRGSLGAIRPIDLTVPAEDIWGRIRQGFAMPDLDTPQVAEQQAWYLARPQYLQRVIERGRLYLYHIVEEIEKRGMPTELALLPMVESAYNPNALSPARASGLWQFIPSTGRMFGLAQDAWKDDRRDIVASTAAALEYLQRIYEMHGDWQLALASYNWGEGSVARAIAKNQAAGLPTEYASLSMPNETRNYVPKLQALKNIIARPALFGIQLDPIPNQPYFATLSRPRDMDIGTAARLANMDVDDFLALNPQHKRNYLRAGQGGLVLPRDRIDTFLTNVENGDDAAGRLQTYEVKAHESLERLAVRFKLSAAELRRINSLGPHEQPEAGTNLLVPEPGTRARGGLAELSMPRLSAGTHEPSAARHDKPARATHARVRGGRHASSNKPASSRSHKKPAAKASSKKKSR